MSAGERLRVGAARIDFAACSAFFAAVMLFTLPFAHSVAVRQISLGVAWLFALFAWRTLAVPRVTLLPLLGAWALLGVISLSWAIDLEYSASELKSEVMYAVLVYLLFFAITDARRLEIFRRVIIFATLASFASAVYWALFLDPTSTGTFFNGPGMYSTYLVMAYPFALVWTLDPASRRRERIWHGAVVAAILIGGAITLNRFFWAVIALQTLLVFAMEFSRVFPRLTLRARLMISVAVLAALVATFGAITVKRVGMDIAQIDAVGDTLASDIRRPIWRSAVARIADKPFTGAGFGRGALRQEFRTEFGHGLYWHAHNVVLNYGISMGIWGIAMALALFGVVLVRLREVWRSPHAELKPYALAAMVMLVGLFAKLMLDDFFYRQTTLFYWAIAGMTLGAYGRARRASSLGTRQSA